MKEKCRQIWNNEWKTARDRKTNKEIYRQTRLFYPCLARKIKDLQNQDRKNLGKVAGFLTGHCNVMYHNNNKDPDTFPNTLCRLCKAPESVETVWHLVARCAVMIPLRTELWNRYEIKSDEEFEWKFKDIERFIRNDRIQELLKWDSG